MGYSVSLVDTEGKVCKVPPHRTGSNVCAGGDDGARMTVTYNYADQFSKVFGENGLRSLHGLTGQESAMMIASAIIDLGVEKDQDYWKSTPGNAGSILLQMFDWIVLHKDARWEIN